MNKTDKIIIVAILIAAVAVAIVVRQGSQDEPGAVKVVTEYKPEQLVGKGLPVLVDIGSDQCIPCKMMAPILEELKVELAGKLQVHFLDVRKHPSLAPLYDIRVIPTQIFYDASGKERFRHEGFYAKEDILAKWSEFGIDLTTAGSQLPTFERLAPAEPDNRPGENICYMCDGNINPKTVVTVHTSKGIVKLCSPHCYFIMYSCLTEDKANFEKKVSVTDWNSGKPVALTQAIFLYNRDENTGRPRIKAFRDREKASDEQATGGGNILSFEALQQQELSQRCGFCDRACYPQDAAKVIVDGGLHTWGCCSHCALGVAARTGKDIEVHEKDRLTGCEIIVKTFDGQIASLEPGTAVAWFGQRQKPDGTWGSAGCFHQGFFANAENLKAWIAQHPYETGRLISIRQALADKMKLSPEQIQKACKIGECVPK